MRNSGSTLLATYRYDALGRRVRETRGSTTTDLYYSSAWQVLEERVGTAVQVSYAWSPVYVDALIARDRDTNADGTLDERLYAVQDANGCDPPSARLSWEISENTEGRGERRMPMWGQ